jgi:tight adherence protein C
VDTRIFSLIAALGAAGSVLSIVTGIVRWLFRPGSIHVRLQELTRSDHPSLDVELRQPLIDRTIRPMFNGLSSMIVNILPRRSTKGIENMARYADLDEQFLATFISLRTVGLLGFGILGITIGVISHQSTVMILLIGLAFGIGAYFFPVFWLQSRAKKRQNLVRNSLPDVLDLLTLCISSMTFEQALTRIVDKSHSPVRSEFTRVLNEIQIYGSRSEALRYFSERVGIDELRSLVTTIIQAEKSGTPLIDVLQAHAIEIRTRRRLHAETLARQAPVKMMFPTVLLIFPPLIIVVMGPMVPQILHAVVPGMVL